jgi:hypothetical protein
VTWASPDCRECFGISCKGGGNRRCIRRDPKPSICAGIIDTYGGIRFLVTHRRQLEHHVRADEVVIVVPRLKVHEPIAWGDVPLVIERIESEVDAWLDRGEPNEPHAREAFRMHRLRRLEANQRSLDLGAICET